MRFSSRSIAVQFLLIFGLSGLFLGCGETGTDIFGTGDDGTSTAEATESIDSTVAESAMLIAFVDDSDPSMDADAVATAAAGTAAAQWTPANCVTAAPLGPEVTLTLSGCTGPYGLANVTGEIVVIYAKMGGDLSVTAASQNLTANGLELELSTAAVYTVAGDDETLTITTQSVAIGPRNQPVVRSGSYVVSWNDTSGCLSLDGTWATTATAQSQTFSTAVGAFQQCGESCPAAGGSITYSSVGDLASSSVVINYDGDATANYVTSGGAVGQLNLSCTPN